MMEFLRDRGATSDLPIHDTIERVVRRLSELSAWDHLAKVADDEPPRVRAMLGAIGQDLGKPDAALRRLRSSINPLTRFDFGAFVGLKHAREWQAR